jgi:CRP/FNR family transcriptional regulator
MPFSDRLPQGKLELLLIGSSVIRYAAGSVAYRPGDPDRVDILSSGMARGFLTAADGRQTTVRYVHAGELMGGVLVMNAGFEGSVQMIADSVVERLDIDHMRQQVATDIAVCDAIAGDLAARYAHTVRTVAVHAFGSVVQRLAFDLLDRACNGQLESGRLVMAASQQELADSIGSVREVVARAVADLRDKGWITTSRRQVRVVDPHALDDFAAEVSTASMGLRMRGATQPQATNRRQLPN